MTQLTSVSGSFRDPSGRVFLAEDHVVRTISQSYSPHWNAMQGNGFLEKAVKENLILSFEECPPLDDSWKSIKSPLLPFISYPYEWSFSQLKDAALHTLDVMDLALKHNLILKDASAYNIQYLGARPIFLDHLSFEVRNPHAPWSAYLQFCRHFIAPLALMAKRDLTLGKLSSLWVEGIGLELACMLLPFRTHFSPLLQLHLHTHAKMQKKYGDNRQSASKVRAIHLSENTVPRLCASLRACIEDLTLPKQKTEWSDYYHDTNYTELGATDKKNFVERVAQEHSGIFAVDLGANTGIYSKLLLRGFHNVLAADIDPLAVEKLYLNLKAQGETRIIPLLQDLANPSPSLGWAEKERSSFSARCKADLISALALIHHLCFGAGIPLSKVSEYFYSLLNPGGILILEFIPLEDSQVKRLLAARSNVFTDYNLEGCLHAFSFYFELLCQYQITDSVRTVLVLKKKN